MQLLTSQTQSASNISVTLNYVTLAVAIAMFAAINAFTFLPILTSLKRRRRRRGSGDDPDPVVTNQLGELAASSQLLTSQTQDREVGVYSDLPLL